MNRRINKILGIGVILLLLTLVLPTINATPIKESPKYPFIVTICHIKINATNGDLSGGVNHNIRLYPIIFWASNKYHITIYNSIKYIDCNAKNDSYGYIYDFIGVKYITTGSGEIGFYLEGYALISFQKIN